MKHRGNTYPKAEYITAFFTSDGKSFVEERKAELHQKILDAYEVCALDHDYLFEQAAGYMPDTLWEVVTTTPTLSQTRIMRGQPRDVLWTAVCRVPGQHLAEAKIKIMPIHVSSTISYGSLI